MNLSKDQQLQSGILKAKEYCQKKLEKLRILNDEVMPDAERAALIGEIKAVRGLLKFIETSSVFVPDDSKFRD